MNVTEQEVANWSYAIGVPPEERWPEILRAVSKAFEEHLGVDLSD